MRSLTCLTMLAVPFLLLPFQSLSAQIAWTKRTIDPVFSGACSIDPADINNDGRVDIVGAGMDGNRIAWWRNDGGTPVIWTMQTVDSVFSGAIFVHAADIDTDGRIDILACAWSGNEIAWWRNEGGDPPAWTKQTIETGFVNAHEACAADIDDDGDLDVIAVSAGNDEVAWWRNDGGSPIQWFKEKIDSTFDGARSVRVADLNADGRLDACGAAFLANDVVAWFQNADSSWTRQTIDYNLAMAHMVDLADIDGDADIDILAVGYNSSYVYWYRNDGGSPITWTKLAVAGNFLGGLGVCCADVDGDGIMDALAASDYRDDVAWWRNDGANPPVWTLQLIDGSFDGAWPIAACDIDDDTDTDVISAAYYADDIAWFENIPTGITEEHAGDMPLPYRPPSIVRGQIQMPAGRSGVVFDVSGRTVSPSHVQPGIYFVMIDGIMRGKVMSVR